MVKSAFGRGDQSHAGTYISLISIARSDDTKSILLQPDVILVHYRITPSINALVPISTSGRRQAL